MIFLSGAPDLAALLRESLCNLVCRRVRRVDIRRYWSTVRVLIVCRSFRQTIGQIQIRQVPWTKKSRQSRLQIASKWSWTRDDRCLHIPGRDGALESTAGVTCCQMSVIISLPKFWKDNRTFFKSSHQLHDASRFREVRSSFLTRNCPATKKSHTDGKSPTVWWPGLQVPPLQVRCTRKEPAEDDSPESSISFSKVDGLSSQPSSHIS